MRQWKQGFTHSFLLEPLTLNEVAHYLDLRMRAAGHLGPGIFSAAAIRLLAEASRGLAGRINILADKALLAAFAQNKHRATRRHVSSAIRESGYGPGHPGRPSRPSRARSWRQAAGFSVAASFLVLALFAFWPKSSQQLATPPTSLPGQPAALPPQPAQPMIALPAEAGKSAKLGVETRARIEATRQWLANVADDRWFLQLLASDARNAGGIEGFVSAAIRQYGTDQVRVYVTDVKGVRRVGVIYGDYPSRQAAMAAATRMPHSLRGVKPFPRKVQWLR
jgi:hypothetical protein